MIKIHGEDRTKDIATIIVILLVVGGLFIDKLIFFVPMALALFFLPTIIAANRRHKNVIPIFLVNFFMGWLLFGWFAAFVWCFSSNVNGDTNGQLAS